MGTEEKELPEKWLSSVEDIENSIFRENSR
jgi:hypothetical protein